MIDESFFLDEWANVLKKKKKEASGAEFLCKTTALHDDDVIRQRHNKQLQNGFVKYTLAKQRKDIYGKSNSVKSAQRLN